MKKIRFSAGLFCLLLSSNLMAQNEQNKMTIVALGDSTTAGTPFFFSPLERPPDGQGNPEGQYSYWMMKKHPEWQVLNRGVNGQRSDEIRARFNRDVLANHPRYCIVLAGVNDIYQNYPLSDIREDLLWIYQTAKADGIVPIAASVLPFNAATEVQGRKIRFLNRWIKQTAETQGIPFLDLNAAVRDPANPDRLKGSPEGLHPDLAGYQRMGEAATKLIEELEANGGVTLKFQLTSPAFIQSETIPQRYTCKGENVSPPLNWTNPPAGAKNFALIMEDPDAPGGTFIHWVVWNIPAEVRALPGAFTIEESLPDGTQQGQNGFDAVGYGGPCPPSGTHRYFFKLYALDGPLTLPPKSGVDDLKAAMLGHILGETDLMGTVAKKIVPPPEPSKP